MGGGKMSSPRITHLSWGHIKVEGGKSYKDVKLYPGGSREWNWNETGTGHVPGVQPSDVEELLDHGARIVILSSGMNEGLRVKPETMERLKDQGVEYHILQTERAAELYNELSQNKPVGGLFHSTC